MNDKLPMPTRWPCKLGGCSGRVIVKDGYGSEGLIADFDLLVNAKLGLAAFNAATEAADMGFDPIGAVQALPELLRAIDAVQPMIERLYAEAMAHSSCMAMIADCGTTAIKTVEAALAAARTRREP